MVWVTEQWRITDMRTTFSTLAAMGFGILGATSASAEMPVENSRIALCVGDSEIVRAAVGNVITYSALSDETGFPVMVEEVVGAEHTGMAASDANGTPVWMEIRPNVAMMQGPLEDVLHGGVDYFEGIQGTSRVVLQARSEGIQEFSYVVTNVETMEAVKKVVKVLVTQCATSTEMAGTDMGGMCEGQATEMVEMTSVIRGTDKMFTFTGTETGHRMIAAKNSGRVVLKKVNPVHGEYLEKTRVAKQGEEGCEFADNVRLDAVEGENAYTLQLCVGETWIAPLHQTVANVEREGVAVTAEMGTSAKAVALRGVTEGFGFVTVDFSHPDAAPLTLYTETVQCND
jgi:hypothetical protein